MKDLDHINKCYNVFYLMDCSSFRKVFSGFIISWIHQVKFPDPNILNA
jgi:hypothetical protein